jgi:hypothetical protein
MLLDSGWEVGPLFAEANEDIQNYSLELKGETTVASDLERKMQTLPHTY